MKKISLLLSALFAFAVTFAAAPTLTSANNLMAATGTTVTLTGTNFTGTTSVTFGGSAAASFTVVSATSITAVVGTGASGSIQVTNPEGSATLAGFKYVSTGAIITDFGGYWRSTSVTANTVKPDSSHMLLGFTYNGTTYSTGVKDATLTANGITFSAAQFKAFPVAGVAGTNAGGPVYLALAAKVDGSASVANTPAITNYSVRTVLTDGTSGLDLGTGITNLPSTAVMTFAISNITAARATDAEPDLVITQIADPATSNDVFSLVDASGTQVGNTITQDMTNLPSFGTYLLDLFTLTPSTAYNTATAYGVNSTYTTRPIRVVAFRLSDFGITAANAASVKSLKITPSGNSDYAFIAYNTASFNLAPGIAQDADRTVTTVCSGGAAALAVIGQAAAGGALSYSWEVSTNGGSSWSALADGNGVSGTSTDRITIATPVNNYRYRATVTEAGNATSTTGSSFTVSVVSSTTPPTSVAITGGGTVCLNTPTVITSTVTGGSNLYYQWQSNASGSFADLSGANTSTYEPSTSQTGSVDYRLVVTSGKGCTPSTTSSSNSNVTVTGVATTTPAVRCSSGSVTLSATATSGNSVSWYDADANGNLLATSSSYSPTVSSTTTYYVSASGCTSALRVAVVATVHPLSVGGSVDGGNVTVSNGNNNTTLTLTGNTGSILSWQSSTDNFVNSSNIANTGKSLTVSNITRSTAYRALVQSGTCSAAYSAKTTVYVGSTLPLRSGSFRALRRNSGVAVEWIAYDLQGTDHFEVERSTDGIHFTSVQTLASGSGTADTTYRWLDATAPQGTLWYRIREVLRSGNSEWSAVLRVEGTARAASFTCFPNPAPGGRANLLLQSLPAGNYTLTVYNSAGAQLGQTLLRHAGGTGHYPLNLPADAGTYLVVLANEGGSRSVLVQVP